MLTIRFSFLVIKKLLSVHNHTRESLPLQYIVYILPFLKGTIKPQSNISLWDKCTHRNILKKSTTDSEISRVAGCSELEEAAIATSCLKQGQLQSQPTLLRASSSWDLKNLHNLPSSNREQLYYLQQSSPDLGELESYKEELCFLWLK